LKKKRKKTYENRILSIIYGAGVIESPNKLLTKHKKMKNTEIQPLHIEGKIIEIRNQNVILDRDVADLYGVQTKKLIIQDQNF
jgi:hypothetical protein